MKLGNNFYFDKEGFFFFLKFVTFVVGLAVFVHFGTILATTRLFFTDNYDTSEIDKQFDLIYQKRSERLEEEMKVSTKLADQNRILDARFVKEYRISDHVPNQGKFIGIDLVNMEAYLYQDGEVLKSFEVLSKGKPGSHWETPSGLYDVIVKMVDGYSSVGQVYMPYSMQFYGNFFIHGWPYYPDGTPVPLGYSGGCIRLSTKDAKEVFDFAEKGTGIFVYDNDKNNSELASVLPMIKTKNIPKPDITARSFIIADINSGSVFFEKNSDARRPIASLTKLMTAIVSNETILFDEIVKVGDAGGQTEGDYGLIKPGEMFYVGDLLYPLLMESNNVVADSLSLFYGKKKFIDWMNKKAKALNMEETSFNDSSGISDLNVSTANDLFLLAKHLYTKKSFILKITREDLKKIFSVSGSGYEINNFNYFAKEDNFLGGKTGFTNAAGETMLSIFSVPVSNSNRSTTLAIIVLGSKDREQDTKNLLDWFQKAAVLAL